MSEEAKAEAAQKFSERRDWTRDQIFGDVLNWFDDSYGCRIAGHMLLLWSAHAHDDASRSVSEYAQWMIEKAQNSTTRGDDYPVGALRDAATTMDNSPTSETILEFVSLFTTEELGNIGI